jgi:hypothetical protein
LTKYFHITFVTCHFSIKKIKIIKKTKKETGNHILGEDKNPLQNGEDPNALCKPPPEVALGWQAGHPIFLNFFKNK